MIEFKIPEIPVDAGEVSISRWLVSEGDSINEGQPLVEIMYEKATQQIDSPVGGFIKKIMAAEGEVVPVGQPVALLANGPCNELQNDEAANSYSLIGNKGIEVKTEDEGMVEYENRVKISPVARILARENQIDLNAIIGRGPGGRVVLKDVKKAIEQESEVQKAAMPIENRPSSLGLKGLRKVIAERMTQSYQSAPHVTLIMRANAANVQSFLDRQKKKERNISLTSVITKASAMALKKYPVIRSLIRENTVSVAEEINIGVAVDRGEGLMVPVISNVDQKGLYDLDRELKELIKRVEEGTLSNEQSAGGCFTISNLGMYDVEIFTPIINPPQSAILGVGKVMEEPVVENGSIIIRPYVTLSLSFDHRIADGALAAKFLRTIRDFFEDPFLMIV